MKPRVTRKSPLAPSFPQTGTQRAADLRQPIRTNVLRFD